MKYKGKLNFPKVGDKIDIKRYGVTYTITSLSKDGLEQGDLVLGYEKGVHCVMGWVRAPHDNSDFPLLKRVYTDKLQPKVGSYSVCNASFCESPEEYFEEYKEKYTTALNIINEYLQDAPTSEVA